MPTINARLIYDKQYIDSVTERYLSSFGITIESVPKNIVEFNSLRERLTYPLQKPIQVKTISDHAARAAACAIVQPHEPYRPACIDIPLCLKASLFCNIEYKSKDLHLAHYLSITSNTQCIQTQSGKAFLVHTLSQPHTDTSIIKQKQRIIKKYATNTTLFNKTTQLLKTIQKYEKHILSYYNSGTSEIHNLMAQYHDSYYWKTIPLLNNNALGLRIGLAVGPVPQIIVSCILAYNMSQFIKNNNNSNTDNTDENTPVKKQTPSVLATMLKSAFPILAYATLSKIQLNDIPNLLQEHLIGIAQYLQTAKQLYLLLSQDTSIADHFAALKVLVQEPTNTAPEFKEWLQLLNTDTFKGDPSFFSYTGRALRAHLLLNTESVQKELARIINAVGELDTYVGLASKINASKEKQARYCFASFDTTSTTPYIKAIDLWNPFIDESAVTTNTIELGGNQPRCIVLSGPNTGGKSTLSKGVLLNTILAQTFGIAAAKNFILTPFSNLDCLTNMADNTTTDNISGLQAEINRAKNVVAKLKSQQTIAFHFMLLDEIFTKTSPDQAEQLVIQFISLISQNPLCIVMAATHYDGVIDFAKQAPHCKNYHMGVETNTEGKITKYTYTLLEGRSMIKNSLQVAQEAGLDIF